MARVSTGVCETAVTVRTRCGLVKSMEYDELLHGRLPLKLKGLFISYVRPAVLYGSEACCLK